MRQVFRVTFEVYDVRFQSGEVGFHVCHLPESFEHIILVSSHVMIQKSCGASLYALTEAQKRVKR